MSCTHKISARGGGFVQVKSVVIKMSFSKGGVTLWFAPIKFQPGGVFLVKLNL